MCSPPTDVPTSKATTGQTNRSKLVRFGGKRDQIYRYDAIPDELISELFWSESDHTARHDDLMVLAEQCLTRNPRLVDSIYLLHGLDYRNKCMLNINQPGFHMYAHMAKLLLASSESRGMEQCLTSFMEDHMHYSINRILSLQDDFFTTNGDNFPNLELLLYKCSSQLSAMPCTFAQLIAQGDAIVAAAYQNELSGQQKQTQTQTMTKVEAFPKICSTKQQKAFVQTAEKKNDNSRVIEQDENSDACGPCPPPPPIVVASPSSPCSPLRFRKRLVATAMPPKQQQKQTQYVPKCA